MSRRTGIAPAAWLMLLTAGRADAHGLHYPKRLRVSIAERRVTVAVRYAIEPGADALALRDRADANADGRVDAREAGAAAALLVRAARAPLRLEFDGREIVLGEQGRELFGVEGAARDSGTLGLELLLAGELPEGGVPGATGELSILDALPGGGHAVAANLSLLRPWRLVRKTAGERSAESDRDATVIKAIYLRPGERARFVIVR